MKKGYLIAEVIIGLLIIGCVSLLLLKPVFQADEAEKVINKAQDQGIEENDSSINNGPVYVTLGVNNTIEGIGAEFDDKTNSLVIEEGGVYNISGILVNGSINVETMEEVEIVLYGVSFKNDSAPVIKSENDLVIRLADGSNSYLDSKSLEGTIKAKGVTLSGNGSLYLSNTSTNINVSDLHIDNVNVIMMSNGFENVSDEISSKMVSYQSEEVIPMQKLIQLINEEKSTLLEFRNVINCKNIAVYMPNLNKEVTQIVLGE